MDCPIKEIIYELDIIPTPTSFCSDCVSRDDMIAAQKQFKNTETDSIVLDGDIKTVGNGRIWIATEVHKIQLSIIVSAHCMSAGHSGGY